MSIIKKSYSNLKDALAYHGVTICSTFLFLFILAQGVTKAMLWLGYS